MSASEERAPDRKIIPSSTKHGSDKDASPEISRATFLFSDGGGSEEGGAFIAPTDSGEGERPQSQAMPSPRDRIWAIAFMINIALTVISALLFGGTGMKAFANFEMLGGRRGAIFGGGGWLLNLLSGTAMVVLAWLFSWGLLMALINCPSKILQVSYLGFAAMLAMVTVWALASYKIMIAGVFLVAFVFFIAFYLHRRNGIPFGAANLKVAALAIKSMPRTVHFAVLMSALQVLWGIVTSIAAAGTVAALETVRGPSGTSYSAVECHDVMPDYATLPSCMCKGELVYNNACPYRGRSQTLTWFWLAALLWGGAVFRNVVAATVTGSVASWWYSPRDPQPVQGAFYRAIGPSFGSLCKAAAFTSAIRLLRRIIRHIRPFFRTVHLSNILLGWINAYLASVQAAVDYALSYAVCFIGIYGLTYSEASNRVSQLFLSHGVTTIGNDTVVGFGLTLFALAATVVYMMATSLVFAASSYASGLASWETVDLVAATYLAAFGFLACVTVISTTLEVAQSGFKAVFVCFVQDPDFLASNHDRQLHDELSRAWEAMHRGCSTKPEEAAFEEVELA